MSFLDQIKDQVKPTEIITTLITQHGGVQGLVQTLEKSGLANIVRSWVGTGQNLPINSAQVAAVMGQDRIVALAAKFGMTPQDLETMIATYLPMLIDKLTPRGKLDPEPSMLTRIVAMGEEALKGH